MEDNAPRFSLRRAYDRANQFSLARYLNVLGSDYSDDLAGACALFESFAELNSADFPMPARRLADYLWAAGDDERIKDAGGLLRTLQRRGAIERVQEANPETRTAASYLWRGR